MIWRFLQLCKFVVWKVGLELLRGSAQDPVTEGVAKIHNKAWRWALLSLHYVNSYFANIIAAVIGAINANNTY